MTGFVLFGGILIVLLATIIRAAVQAGEDTGAALRPAERRDAAIEALRDIELEYRTGKLTDDEYRTIRGRLERAAIEARNALAAGVRRSAPRSSAGVTEAPGTCPDCETALAGGEAFCPACGASVAAAR